MSAELSAAHILKMSAEMSAAHLLMGALKVCTEIQRQEMQKQHWKISPKYDQMIERWNIEKRHKRQNQTKKAENAGKTENDQKLDKIGKIGRIRQNRQNKAIEGNRSKFL